MSDTVDSSAPQALLEVHDLVQEFKVGGRGAKSAVVHALAGISMTVWPREVVGVVGETGCGKSTMARAILQAPKPTSGQVLLHGRDLVTMKGRELHAARRHIQMVFQDPFSSLDPRWTVGELVEEPLNNYKVGTPKARRSQAHELMDRCGLDPDHYAERHPRQLSGGQCQRVAIARSLSIAPELIIFDEALSSLDVSIHGQIINLLEDLRDEFGIAYIFIAHDLAVVRHMSNRIAVMYLGTIVEIGPAEDVCTAPFHHYTAALITAVPEFEVDTSIDDAGAVDDKIYGELPSPIDPPSGCRFHTRCPRSDDRCVAEEPRLIELAPEHWVACHHPVARAPEPAIGAPVERKVTGA